MHRRARWYDVVRDGRNCSCRAVRQVFGPATAGEYRRITNRLVNGGWRVRTVRLAADLRGLLRGLIGCAGGSESWSG